MKTRLVYTIAGIAILSLGVAAYQQWSSPKKTVHNHTHDDGDEHEHDEETTVHLSDEQIKTSGVQTKKAGPGKLSMSISTRGKIVLHPDKLVHILPKISGVAKEARKNIGDAVQEGEVLAILESREMADIKANYLAAKEKEILALSLLEREKRLYDKKVSAEQDYLNAKSSYTEARINFELARQNLHAFGLDDEDILGFSTNNDRDLRLYNIRSPLKGVVIARHINRGEYIENSSTIYEIADLGTVWIEIGIYPKDLVKVREGQIVDVALQGSDKKAKAKIIYLSPIIQDETITAKAVAELDNADGNWRPGSFVKVDISTENLKAPVVVPKEAIQEMKGQEYVFVKSPEGFEIKPVQTGATDNDNIVILSGLDVGEEYATTNTFLLKAHLNKDEVEHD